MERMHALGARVVRLSPNAKNNGWKDVEEENGQFVWHDFIVDRVLDKGMLPILDVNLLAYPPWTGNTQYPSESDWDDYVYNLVDHYGSLGVNLFEHTNEAAFHYTGAEYGAYTRSCYGDVKNANPAALIASSAPNGPASTSDLSNYPWLDLYFDDGTLANADVVAVHPYHQLTDLKPEDLEWDLANVHNIIKAHNNGVDKPIWVTEFGYGATDYQEMLDIPYSENNFTFVEELTAANYTVRAYITAISNGATKVNYLCSEGDTDIVCTTAWGFENADSNKSIKKVGAAFSTMTYLLEGKSFDKKLNMSDNLYTRGYRFSGEEADVVAVWSTNGTRSSSIYSGDNPVDIYDITGNHTTVLPINGYVEISLTESPKFIDGVSGTEPEPVEISIQVLNGDFEADVTNQQNYWYAGTWVGSPLYSWANDYVHGGVHSAKIYNSQLLYNGGYAKAGNYKIPVEPNGTYNISVWTKTDSVSSGVDEGAKFYVQFYDETDNALGTAIWSSDTTGTLDWSEKSIEVTSPESAAVMQVEVRLQGSGTVWYDDISVKQIVAVPTPTPVPISITNGDFELNPIDANGYFRGNWSGFPIYTWATDYKHGGNCSARISNYADTYDGGYAKAGIFRVSGITSNKSYTVSVWQKTSNVSAPGEASMYAQFYDLLGNALGTPVWSPGTSGTVDWAERSFTLTAPYGAVTMQIELRLRGRGTAWYDDLSVLQNN